MIKNNGLFGIVTLGVLIFLLANETSAQKKLVSGIVCGDAAQSECTKSDDIFKPFSLVFKLSPKAVKDPAQFAAGEQSEFFYAVLLKTVNGYKKGGGCREITETERLAVQEQFPHNKAFSWNYYCASPSEGDKYIEYKFPGVDPGGATHLLAVYGGQTQAEAAKILIEAKKKYPKARVVRMRAAVGEQLDV